MALSETDSAYFKTMTEKQLDDYLITLSDWEAKGNDATEYRQAVADRRIQIVKEAEQKEQEALNRPKYQLDKLEIYQSTPRNPNTAFFKDTAGSAPWFFKNKWLEMYKNAALVYAAVVQANNALWEPGNGTFLPLVVVIAFDEPHIHDINWLQSMAEKISELKSSTQVPDDCKKLITVLRDDNSFFNFKIGSSIAGNADAWCVTLNIEKQSELGNKCLPADGIVPFLVATNKLKENFIPGFALIPSKYYM